MIYKIGSMAGVLMVALLFSPSIVFAHTDRANPTHTHGATALELQQVSTYTSMLKQGGVQYLQYGPAVSTDTTLVVSTAKARKTLMEALAKKDPQAFLAHALSSADRQKLPLAAQAYVETEGAKKGVLTVVHGDDFVDPKNSTVEYELLSGTTTYDLILADVLPTQRSGATVTTQAYTLGSVVVVKEGAANVTVDTEPPSLESVGEQKTLVMLVDYEGAPAQSFTAEQLKANLNTGNIGNYFREESYGQAWINADVYGWYRLPKPLSGENGDALNDGQVYKIIKDNNIPLASYRRVVLVNFGSGTSWSNVGVGAQLIDGVTYRFSKARVRPESLGVKSNDLNRFENVFAHEFGHSLGLPHANTLRCRAGTASTRLFEGICVDNDYGSPFEVMGGRAITLTSSAAYRYLLGWLTQENSLFIKTPSTATIQALGASAGVRSAIIFDPTTNLPIYAVERRKAIGYDSVLATASPEDGQGIVVNRILRASDKGPFLSHVLDLHAPYGGYEPKPYALKVGGPAFTDPSTGVTLSTTAITSDTATFSVAYAAPTCVRLAPTFADFPPYDWYSSGVVHEVVAGASVVPRARYMSENSPVCPPATYEIVATVPAGWSATKGTVVGGSKNLFTLATKVTVPSAARGGKYVIPYTIRDVSGTWSFSDKVTISVTQPNALPGEGSGDVNGDQTVLSSDALLALRIAVGQQVVGANLVEADVDCKGGVTAGDALIILRAAVGSIALPLTCASAQAVATADLVFTKEGSGAINSAFSGPATAPTLTLNATPAKGQSFIGWQGACTGRGTCVVSLATSTKPVLKAVFAPTIAAAILALDPTGVTVTTLATLVLVFLAGLIGVTLWKRARG